MLADPALRILSTHVDESGVNYYKTREAAASREGASCRGIDGKNARDNGEGLILK